MEWVIAIATRYHCAYVCHEADWPIGAIFVGDRDDGKTHLESEGVTILEHAVTVCLTKILCHGIIAKSIGGCVPLIFRYLGAICLQAALD